MQLRLHLQSGCHRSKMEWYSPGKEIPQWTDLQIIRAKGAAPLFDYMGFVKRYIDYIISELFFPPQHFESAIIKEQLRADNDQLVSPFANILSIHLDISL